MPKPEFYQDDRERVKSRSMLPTDTLHYIEALEAIAKAAYEAWRRTSYSDRPSREAVDCLNVLYDKLEVVDFMDEND